MVDIVSVGGCVATVSEEYAEELVACGTWEYVAKPSRAKRSTRSGSKPRDGGEGSQG